MKRNYDYKEELLNKLYLSNDFSGCEKIREYIRIYEIIDDEKKKNILKFIIYKLSAQLNNQEMREFDCDVSINVNTLYKKIYTWLYDYEIENQKTSVYKYELVNKNKFFRGDTMTSALVPLKRYLELKGINKQKMKESTLEEFILDNINRIDISENVSSFLHNVHTIGNFIPVPQGFNIGRSNFGRWDSWDLTLQQIFLWYQDNKELNKETNDRALEILFSSSKNKSDCVFHCVEWLKMFPSWEEFVNDNYLKHFLDNKGKPVLFFKNHTFENPLPQTIEESEEFFKKANICIVKRGMDISLSLEKKSSMEENMKSLSIFQKIKNIINSKIKSNYSENFAKGLKKNPMNNLEDKLLFITKWMPICYSVLLLVIYCFMKDKDYGLFSDGRSPLYYFGNNCFVFFILVCLVAGWLISFNKTLNDTTWKYKKILKYISYIGGYGICFSLIVIKLYHSNFMAYFLNGVVGIVGYSETLTIVNILTMLFMSTMFIETFFLLISVIFSFILGKTREVLIKVIFRVIEFILVSILISLTTGFIDNWKSVLMFGGISVVALIVLVILSSGGDGMLKVVDENNKIIAKIKKEDLFK